MCSGVTGPWDGKALLLYDPGFYGILALLSGSVVTEYGTAHVGFVTQDVGNEVRTYDRRAVPSGHRKY